MISAPFPRGGGGQGSEPKRGREVAFTVKSDDLFGAKRLKRVEVLSAPKKAQKGKDKKNGASSDSKKPLAIGLGQVIELGGDRKVTKIEQLTFNKFTQGCLVLGYVLSITPEHALISLPGGTTGRVAYSEISDHCYRIASDAETAEALSTRKSKMAKYNIAALLTPRTPVKCYVLGEAVDKKSAKTKKTLELSLRLSLVNRGIALKHLVEGTTIAATVSSEEDGGYVMSAGIPDVSFFLPADKIPASKGRLVPGATHECVVQRCNHASRAVTLRGHPKSVREATVLGAHTSFHHLLPGLLVNIIIDKVVQVRKRNKRRRMTPFIVHPFITDPAKARQIRRVTLLHGWSDGPARLAFIVIVLRRATIHCPVFMAGASGQTTAD